MSVNPGSASFPWALEVVAMEKGRQVAISSFSSGASWKLLPLCGRAGWDQLIWA